MALKCSMCGANLYLSSGESVLKCEYCGTQYVVVPLENSSADRENAEITRLMKRVHIFLDDFQWKKADQYCEKVLDLDPENAFAYLGKLLAEFEVRNIESLARIKNFTFYGNNNYQHIMKFGSEELKDKLRQINEDIKPRERKYRYENAIRDMQRAEEEKEEARTDHEFMRSFHEETIKSYYKSAAQDFLALKDYENANELYEDCLRKGGLYDERLYPSYWALYWR